MAYVRTLIVAFFALFAMTPLIDEKIGIEQSKADTAAMVTYASLADGALVTEAPKARCLVFYFDGCPPCAALHRTIDKDLVTNGWTVGKGQDFEFVDVHSKDDRVTRFRRGRSWMCPTLVLIDAQGKELDRKVGALSAKQITDWVGFHRNSAKVSVDVSPYFTCPLLGPSPPGGPGPRARAIAFDA